MNTKFLPISREDMQRDNINQLDFIIVTGDAYVDHPSFGTAIIGRVIESQGFTVGVISQPDWNSTEDFMRLGSPKYAFLVNSGNIDSMVAHYTVAKRRRNFDEYTAGGKGGKRPDRAVIVYCNRLRECYQGIPIIIGGLEASLRRFAHYDYWSDSVRNPIIVDSGANILVYGMGERQTLDIIKNFKNGLSVDDFPPIDGTTILSKTLPQGKYALCPSVEKCKKDKVDYAKACKIQYDEQDSVRGITVVQPYSLKYIVQYKPASPLTQAEFDWVYELPFTRKIHPIYKDVGVPAIEEVEFSITSSRGCFGGCNFCSLAFHQGRMITARSHDSIVNEANTFLKMDNFKGYIHDVGGPTANFRHLSCQHQKKVGMCKDKRCLAPTPCKELDSSHDDYRDLLRKLRNIKGIKKVFIRSGIRYDYLLHSGDDEFFTELVRHHISGQLKVAPEHCSESVLNYMSKPSFDVYRKFYKKFKIANEKAGLKQFLVPYLMSSHPGSRVQDAINLALYLKEIGYNPEQVQDFYPTPGTISTCMYYTGLDPLTMKEVFVPRTAKEKSMQRALLQFNKAENKELVENALRSAGRADLIGYGKNCLVNGVKTPQYKKWSKK